jgi:hypothetical protein
MWDIIRKPTVSSLSSRDFLMCCSETSASVQWVATLRVSTPQSAAISRSGTVPMPGSSSAEILARFTWGRTARRYSSSLWAGKP